MRLPSPAPVAFSSGLAKDMCAPKAEADMKKALELSPEQPYVLNYLGYSWIDQGLITGLATGTHFLLTAVAQDVIEGAGGAMATVFPFPDDWTMDQRQRAAIVGFPAHGSRHRVINLRLANA